MTLADWEHLRDDLGATDEEIMETLETVNFGNSVNLITCAIGGGKEEWYTYNMEDFRSALVSIENGDFGDLSWIEEMPLSETNLAFQSLHNGTMASAKVILKPSF